MALLILDNYDSFTYNLVHQVEQFTDDFEVRRNDEIELAELDRFDAFLLSPGPGLPKDAGVMSDLIKHYSGNKKILGVCLGMQGILEHLGAELINMPEVLHGRSTEIDVLDHNRLFHGMPNRIKVGRYHSWAVNELPGDVQPELKVSSSDANHYIMSIEWPEKQLYGVQFHPESIMTEYGLKIIENWLKIGNRE